MKKFDKTKLLVVLGITIVSILSITAVAVMFGRKLKVYDKYELSIMVDAVIDGTKEHEDVIYRYDGKYGKATLNRTQTEAFVIDKRVEYLKGDTVYSFRPKVFYDDLIEILVKCFDTKDKISEVDGIVNYTTSLNYEEINRILEALAIEKKSQKSALVKFSVKDGYVSSVNFSVSDIENYESVSVMLHYEELDREYSLDISKLTNPKRPYKYEESEENIFSVLR